jgi:tRNA threonylcarbamoyladenosine biosynthesis protein TsaE
MSKNQITTKNSVETKEFAKVLLEEWLEVNKNKNSSWLVCLYGDLGGGKTTFVQGLAERLSVKETVNSPTFLIMKKYSISRNEALPSLCGASVKKYTLYHFDCYRISDHKEILDLGWEEIINGENNIIVIEWPEKIEKILPKKRLDLKFEFVDEDTRKINF